MTIIIVFFLFTFVVFGGITSALATRNVNGPLRYEGPATIADTLQGTNRKIGSGVLVFCILLAGFEALLPDVHRVMMDLQYVIGDPFRVTPGGVVTFASGAGLSWGLYLSVVIAAYVGAILGAWGACKRFPSLSHLSPVPFA